MSTMYLVQFESPVYLKPIPPSKVIYSHEPCGQPLYETQGIITDNIRNLMIQEGIKFSVLQQMPIKDFIARLKQRITP